MSEPEIGGLLALATAMLWTSSAMAWTASGKRVGALAVSFLRLIVACGLMAVYCRIACGRWLPTDADARTWRLLGTSGFFGFFLCDICLFKSMLMLGPRLTLLVFSLSPPITAIIAWAFTNDDLALGHWLAMAVTLAGVVWVVVEQPDTDEVAGGCPDFRLSENGTVPIDAATIVLGTKRDSSPTATPLPLPAHRWLGIVLAVLAALTNSIGYVFSKQGIGDYDAVSATLIRALVALPAYALLITLWRRWPAMLAATRDLKAMGILSLGAAVGPFAGVALSMAALRFAPAGVVATIIATMPVLILPFSILVYHEKVSPRAIGGAVIAVAGVAMLVM